jgi:hypothetical protein
LNIIFGDENGYYLPYGIGFPFGFLGFLGFLTSPNVTNHPQEGKFIIVIFLCFSFNNELN